MKVLFISGNLPVGGNTATAPGEMVKVFEREGMATEIIRGGRPGEAAQEAHGLHSILFGQKEYWRLFTKKLLPLSWGMKVTHLYLVFVMSSALSSLLKRIKLRNNDEKRRACK